jgi:predicted ATPase
MHLKSVTFHPDKYPADDRYPFNLPIFRNTGGIAFDTPVTLFVGENGSGKSTLLEALAHKCEIHIWKEAEGRRFENNPLKDQLFRYFSIEWADGIVPGSFFGSTVFQDFARMLDDWASVSPGLLDYFGGRSLLTQSHGQSIVSFFRARYALKGLYLLDEPETALSPKSQIETLRLIVAAARAGRAQFIIATHSPILLACPEATIYRFDDNVVLNVRYEETEHYRVFSDFMKDPRKYLP